ncbi:MAG: hypothetical protein IJI43_03595 [Bacilli bacterium]|nr:hypothetical protein [Bacilli bacterium]
MLKFIVSNLYGDGIIYDTIMAYLENVHKFSHEDIELYINGNLIDRGEDSARMLLDVYNRTHEGGSIKVHYLAGKHELMMCKAFLERNNSGAWSSKSIWFAGHGGSATVSQLEKLISPDEEEEIGKFICNLQVYHKFNEKLDNRNIVLVHEKGLERVESNNLNDYINYVNYEDSWNAPKEDNFIIEGYRPVRNKSGYEYESNYNALNIDGGCKNYVCGDNSYDHIPLVELDSQNNRLMLLTFNHNNEITFGSYFSEGRSLPMNNSELDMYRYFLDKNVKVKKLSF